MAWENNAGRNGNYKVSKSFRMYLDTMVVDGVSVPTASFAEGDTVVVRYCIDDSMRGPGYDVRRADKTVNAVIFRRALEDLIKVGALTPE